MVTNAVLEPLDFGDELHLKNRAFMSAMTRNRGFKMIDLMVEYYKQRAGAGLIISEATPIMPMGSEWLDVPLLYNNEHVGNWRKITDAVHERGGRMFVQLWHTGRTAHQDLPNAEGEPVWAPSAIPARGGKFRTLPGQPGYQIPHAIPDPQVFVKKYRTSAELAKQAGFDGVELHAGNGYLVHEFLVSHSNQRTDKYGGNVENRNRFCFEILEELIKVFGPNRVGIKISPCGGYNDMGEATVEAALAQYEPLLRHCEKLRLAYVACIRYPAQGGLTYYDGVQRTLNLDVFQLKPLLKNTKFIINQDVMPAEANKMIEAGQADGVLFARLYITNPDLVDKIRNNESLDMNYDYKTFYVPNTDDPRTGYIYETRRKRENQRNTNTDTVNQERAKRDSIQVANQTTGLALFKRSMMQGSKSLYKGISDNCTTVLLYFCTTALLYCCATALLRYCTTVQ